MKEMVAIFHDKKHKCVLCDNKIYLFFDNLSNVPRGNGWCLVSASDSLCIHCFIRPSNQNIKLYNDDCKLFE